jgi:hypothetical protein
MPTFDEQLEQSRRGEFDQRLWEFAPAAGRETSGEHVWAPACSIVAGLTLGPAQTFGRRVSPSRKGIPTSGLLNLQHYPNAPLNPLS